MVYSTTRANTQRDRTCARKPTHKYCAPEMKSLLWRQIILFHHKGLIPQRTRRIANLDLLATLRLETNSRANSKEFFLELFKTIWQRSTQLNMLISRNHFYSLVMKKIIILIEFGLLFVLFVMTTKRIMITNSISLIYWSLVESSSASKISTGKNNNLICKNLEMLSFVKLSKLFHCISRPQRTMKRIYWRTKLATHQAITTISADSAGVQTQLKRILASSLVNAQVLLDLSTTSVCRIGWCQKWSRKRLKTLWVCIGRILSAKYVSIPILTPLKSTRMSTNWFSLRHLQAESTWSWNLLLLRKTPVVWFTFWTFPTGPNLTWVVAMRVKYVSMISLYPDVILSSNTQKMAFS